MTALASSPAPAQRPEQPLNDDEPAPQRKGVLGWVKGKIQKRNLINNLDKLNLDEIEKNATLTTEGEPSDLDIAMGLGEGGVVDEEQPVPEDEKIDLDAVNDEGLLVGWGKRIQENEWVNKAVTKVTQEVTNYKEQEELRRIHEEYKDEIKADPEIQALNKKIKKLKKNLKVQRLNGDRTMKRNGFARDKEQRELEQKSQRLQKSIWTFANSSMNSHEYAKAMMRASARLKRKGMKVHTSEKALAMEAAVLRNMHRMLAVQKQYTMSKRACNDVSSFVKRCKGWLDNKLADGERGVMVLEATSQSMAITYKEVIEAQEAILPKFRDPKNHTFKKERLKTILPIPKGLRSMPTFLKGPKRPPMKISLRKKIEEEDPNMKGYKTFKERNKEMKGAWEQEMKQYENLLEVGGADTKIIEDVSDLGDSEDEIEENLAAVQPGAAAAVANAQVNLKEMVKEQHGDEVVEKAEAEAAKAELDSPLAGDKEAETNASTVVPDEEADAAALEEAKKSSAANDEDPEVDEGALPDEVKQEDLDNLLDKEAEEVSAHPEENDNTVEEGLHQVVEDALADVGADIASDDDDDDESDAKDASTRDESTKVSS